MQVSGFATGLGADPHGGTSERLGRVLRLMRAMSLADCPRELGRAVAAGLRELVPYDRLLTLSRRGLEPPRFRVTLAADRDDASGCCLLAEGGCLGALFDREQPRIVDDLEIADDDPGAPLLRGMRSLLAIPIFEGGAALTMTILLRADPAGFGHAALSEDVILCNLTGQAASRLALFDELREANDLLEREMRVVTDLRTSLLPRDLPAIPALDLAVYDRPARCGGGDFYDFFAISGGRWGVLIADASGHGAHAAVMMAITHSLAHGRPEHQETAPGMLGHLNHQLATRYALAGAAYVTAFYAVYDPSRRALSYASAGHSPPLLRRAGTGAVSALKCARHFPLGLFADQHYEPSECPLAAGDQLAFYTDGIVEAQDPSGRVFGVERLDALLARGPHEAEPSIRAMLAALARFTAGRRPADDQTLLIATVT